MKSLVLKDLYHVGHTARSMLFIMAVLAVAFLSTSGVEGYIFMCAILYSMMIVTTFAFDDASKWERYAMITPISRKDLVAGKFIVLAIFCAAGSLFGLIAGTVGGTVLKKMSLDPAGIGGLLLLALMHGHCLLFSAACRSRSCSNSGRRKAGSCCWYPFFCRPGSALASISCSPRWASC